MASGGDPHWCGPAPSPTPVPQCSQCTGHDDCWHSQWSDPCSWAGTEPNCMSSGGDPHWCGSLAAADEVEVEKQVAVEEEVADCSQCTGQDDCWHSQWSDPCSWAGTEANCMSSGGDPHWCGSAPSPAPVPQCSQCTGHDDCWHSQWAEPCSWAGTKENCLSSGGDPHWCGAGAGK